MLKVSFFDETIPNKVTAKKEEEEQGKQIGSGMMIDEEDFNEKKMVVKARSEESDSVLSRIKRAK